MTYRKYNPDIDKLTSLEVMICRLVLEGKTARVISEELHYTYNTIRKYCEIIRDKMHQPTILEAAREWLKQCETLPIKKQ